MYGRTDIGSKTRTHSRIYIYIIVCFCLFLFVVVYVNIYEAHKNRRAVHTLATMLANDSQRMLKQVAFRAVAERTESEICWRWPIHCFDPNAT